MSRLKISGRLYLVFALFLAPVSFLVYSVVVEKNISIDFARKELTGRDYLAALRDLQMRLYPYLSAVAAGNGPEMATTHAALIRSLNTVAEAEAGLGATLDSSELARTLLDRGRQLVALPLGDSAAIRRGGGETATALRALVGRIGDQSNLILDPDLDSFYVMDAVVVKLPDLVDRIAALTDHAVRVVAKGNLSADDRTDFLLLKGGFDSTVEGLDGSVTSGYRGNADGSLKAGLDGSYQSLKQTLARCSAALNAAVLERSGAGTTGAQLWALQATALATAEQAWKTGDQELARLLQLRIDGFTTGLWTSLGITGLLFLVAFAFGGLTVLRGVVRPIEAMTEVMAGLAAGNKTVAIPATANHDEIGAMARALTVFKDTMIQAETLAAEQIRDQAAGLARSGRIDGWIIEFEAGVSGVVQRVASAAARLQTDAQELSANADQTNRQAVAVAAAADQASANVQTVAAATEQLSCSVSEIGRQVEDSARIAGFAVGEATKTNTTVASLSDAAQKIGDVVGLINDIASQTNLLALNATIEAARAGEAGKGFAVVASEVKNLANQTAKATEDIQTQVAQMQAVTGTAVDAIRQITGTIQRMSAITATIAAAVGQQGAATQEIARNVQQASTGTLEVSSNIGGVTQAASHTGEMAGQALTAAHDLSQQAERLRGEVDGFIGRVRAA